MGVRGWCVRWRKREEGRKCLRGREMEERVHGDKPQERGRERERERVEE